MRSLPQSFAFRLALGYGALIVAAMAVLSAVFYFGTVGVIERGIDAKLTKTSEHLTELFDTSGADALQLEIHKLLTDGIEQDTEDYLLLDPEGGKLIGNLAQSGSRTPLDRLTDQTVTRYSRVSASRLLSHRLSNGAVLIVGRDMHDVYEIMQLVLRSLGIGAAVTVLLAIGGALLFRRQIENRIATIRRTAIEIEAGDLSRRIPVGRADDEFSRLNRDLNRMLDRIQRLMDGVRDVSNALAHDLRTPLGRIRGLLEEAMRPGASMAQLRATAGAGIEEIDELIGIFDKLLQIAEAESGARRQSFRPVSVKGIITNVVELYDASAEEQGIGLLSETDVDIDDPTALGDEDLLLIATSNLVDNAIKYAGRGATIRIRATQSLNSVSIVVRDDGPGIPAPEKEKAVTRFYRLDRSRSRPGNGLGLPIVTAISQLHEGRLSLEDGAPGLIARIILPRCAVPTLPNGNAVAMEPIRATG
jgi:signal transduction histidine kinase